MAFLTHAGRYEPPASSPRPGLILLDLNLPRLDGREILRRIKLDPELKRIPVVILTTSDEQTDVQECYEKGANTYMTKPVDFRKFIDAVITIGRYWLCLAEIPESER
jgi:CheY-like chemotaxis protein